MEKRIKFRRLHIILAVAFLIPFGVKAQTGIQVIEEEGIDNVMNLFIQKNQSIENLPGYRIQIYNGNSRDKMNEIQQKFKKSYPDVETYLIYQAPYFKLRAGDFTEMIEANKFLMTIRKEYPSAFMVTEEIKLK